MLSQTVKKPRHRIESDKAGSKSPISHRSLVLSVVIALTAILYGACSRTPDDPKRYLPADSLIAVASDDLGAALRPVVRNASKQAGINTLPDLSNLDGLKIAAAITGFEAREIPADGNRSVLDLRPKVVAIMELNAWSWQVNSIIENCIGELINQAYGGEAELESYPISDGQYYVWTARDGRRIMAFVAGGLVFIANDEAALDKVLSVRSGSEQALSFNFADAKGENREIVARGIITEAGIAQISNILAIQMAIGSVEDEESKQFISAALPVIVRNSIKQVEWTAVDDGAGFEDRYRIVPEPKIGQVFAETLEAGKGEFRELAKMIPADAAMITFYNLKDSRIAWRSILLSIQAVSDPVTARLAPVFAKTLAEPYGIDDTESFLAAAGNRIASFRIDPEGEQVAVTGLAVDETLLRRSMTKELAETKNVEKIGSYTILRAEEYCYAAGDGGRFAAGDCAAVEKAVGAATAGGSLAGTDVERQIADVSRAAAVTFSTRNVDLAAILSLFGGRVPEGKSGVERIITTTNFDSGGAKRSAKSDFGLIGWMLESGENKE